jgi:hypothetical protein
MAYHGGPTEPTVGGAEPVVNVHRKSPIFVFDKKEVMQADPAIGCHPSIDCVH